MGSQNSYELFEDELFDIINTKIPDSEPELNFRKTLIDTSIILDGIDAIRAASNEGDLFITDVILREVDGNKNREGSVGFNAREFLREFNGKFIKSYIEPVKKGDVLYMGTYKGIEITVINRKYYHSHDINDSKIIEIAKDYYLRLKTFDQSQAMRLNSQGGIGESFIYETKEVDYIPDFLFFILTLALVLYVTDLNVISSCLGTIFGFMMQLLLDITHTSPYTFTTQKRTQAKSNRDFNNYEQEFSDTKFSSALDRLNEDISSRRYGGMFLGDLREIK